MRETVGIPAGAVVYFVATVVLLIIVQIIVPEPQEYSTLITGAIAVIAFEVTCAAVQHFSNETGVKIVGVMIALFWMVSLGVDVFSGFKEVLDFLGGGGEMRSLENLRELTEAVWNKKICAGVSVVLAVWTLSK